MFNKIQSIHKWAFLMLNGIATTLLLPSCSGDWGAWGNQAPPELPVISIEKRDFETTKSFPGISEGLQEVEIRAKVSGYIQEIFVDEGQYVEKGQPLFKLEANQLSQNAEAAKSAIETAKANVETAKLEVANLEPLVKKDIVGPAQLSSAKAKLLAEQARLEQAKSNYQALKANAQYTNITSPINGFVGKLAFRQGALVGPSTSLAITTVSNTNDLYVYFSVSPADFQSLTNELEGVNLLDKLHHLPLAHFVAEDLHLELENGMVEAYTGKINSATGAIQLRARFSNASGTLLSGTQGMITLTKKHKNVIGIPASAAFKMQGLDMVYVLGQGDTLNVRPISIKEKTKNYYLIESGVGPKETILAQGVNNVYPNSVIVPLPTTADSILMSYQTVFK